MIAINGFDRIIKYLAEGVDVCFNQVVDKVDYSQGSIKVHHNGLISEADAVIVTVPLGVLKTSAIDFQPPLPTYKQEAIKIVGMGCVNKFLLVWDECFWDDVLFIYYTPEKMDRFNLFLNFKKLDSTTNALVTFAYSDEARRSETQDDQEIISEIMAYLRDIYGDKVPMPKQFARTKWYSNPYAKGAYSYPSVGSKMSHFDDLAAEVDDKVFFAGEHTSRDFYGNSHGALLSGEREADKVIRALSKSG